MDVLTVHTQGDHKMFKGRVLGTGTSRKFTHIHPLSDPPGPGVRCSGCRWNETRIMWSEDDTCFVVEISGISSVPGDENRYRSWWVPRVEDLIEVLLINTPPRRRATGSPEQEIPRANRDALEEAADNDNRVDAILTAYEDEEANRA